MNGARWTPPLVPTLYRPPSLDRVVVGRAGLLLLLLLHLHLLLRLLLLLNHRNLHQVVVLQQMHAGGLRHRRRQNERGGAHQRWARLLALSMDGMMMLLPVLRLRLNRLLLVLLGTGWYHNRRRNLPDGSRGLGDPPAHRLAVEARQPCGLCFRLSSGR